MRMGRGGKTEAKSMKRGMEDSLTRTMLVVLVAIAEACSRFICESERFTHF